MELYIVVLGFIALDLISGLIKAAYHGNINSTAIRKGLMNKLAEIIAIAVAQLLEFQIDLPMHEIVIGYICYMESVSIIENIAEFNPKLKKFLMPYLKKLKPSKEEEEDEKRN